MILSTIHESYVNKIQHQQAAIWFKSMKGIKHGDFILTKIITNEEAIELM